MDFKKLIYRNLVFHKRMHLGVVMGTMLSATILIGALIIGDSVRYSLNQMVHNRLGKTQYALTSGDRIFRQELRTDLADSGIEVSALLHTNGIVVSLEGQQQRLNKIQFYGVDSAFDGFSPTHGIFDSLSSNQVVISLNIAKKLDLSEGDEVLLRFQKLDAMPKDSPLSDDSDITVAERFTIKTIASDAMFGRFGLKSEQIAPFNVFLAIDKLSALMEMVGAANMLLVQKDAANPMTIIEINEVVRKAWTLEDSGIELEYLVDRGEIDLRSNRIFLDDQIINAAADTGIQHTGIFTYFVNEINFGNQSTPYSFVSAMGSKLLGRNLMPDEIIINHWLAEDLNAVVGSKLELKYFTVGKNKALIESATMFIVSEVVSQEGIFADKNLLPEYPGLTESESCMDWHPGIPIDFDKIRKKDEQYWDQYKGTPKAYISLETAVEIWGNRFGTLSALRFHTDDLLEKALADHIDPAHWNIQFVDVEAQGLEASSNSVDFGGLFIGLSFFVMLSALLLTSLLYVFNMESRSHETGLFLGLGFNHGLIQKIVLFEASILILIGSTLGCLVSLFYNQLILLALQTVWSDVIGTSALEIHVKPMTLVLGFVIISFLNFTLIWWNLRKTLNKKVHSLQRGIAKIDYIEHNQTHKALWLGLSSLALVIALMLSVDAEKGAEVLGLYFVTGSLLLVSSMAFASFFLDRLNRVDQQKKLTILRLALKEITRRKSRTMMLLTLLSSSLFIVFTVGINKKVVNQETSDRSSGTGGFSLIGETSIPLLEDLNDGNYRNKLGLEAYVKDELNFIQFKVKAGEDASCLNLNRVKTPQVISVNPDDFGNRGAFTFSSMGEYVDRDHPWSVLDMKLPENTIPGIADASVIQWQLGKAVGDTLTYTDDNGKEFSILLVAGTENSIFQGNLLISESNFLEKFPSISGTKMFVTESSDADKIMGPLNHSLQDFGLNLSTTVERLSEFNKIENTYLSIFLILGSFGVLIGCLGIGIVLYRNISEQKSEMALLKALGFEERRILMIISIGYVIILGYGIGMGIITSMIASLPSLLSANSEVPVLTISAIIITILCSGLSAIYFSATSSLKGVLPQLLRYE